MIKNSFKIFKDDLKVIFTNTSVLIVVIALAILPSLYAWINIKASWNPYDQTATRRIKVDVVNNDIGSTFNGKTLNLGNDIVEGLKKNESLGWQFKDDKTTEDDLNFGRVYAAIIIPKNFSEDIVSFASDNVRKAQIKYVINEKLNAIAPKITDKGAGGVAENIKSEVIGTVSEVALTSAKSVGIDLENDVLPKFKEASEILENVQNAIPEIINVIDKTQNAIDQGQKYIRILQAQIPKLDEAIGKVSTVVDDINNIVDKLKESPYILPEIQDNIIESQNQLNGIVDDSKVKLEDIKTKINSVSDRVNTAEDILIRVDDMIPFVSEKVDIIKTKIDEIDSSSDLKDIINLVKGEVSNRVDFLTDPVTIKNEVLYPMGTYGSQMSPFYSSLAAWVGLTLLVSILSVNTKGKYNYIEVYFGKMMTFILISCTQGLIIALGDLYLLHIQRHNEPLFISGMVFTSFTFAIIVYSLVSIFGDIGKVIAIVIMIFQVAGSGGTFPIQLTSPFFIALNPYLPFTYTISILRESIGGVVVDVVKKDILILCIYIIISIVISLLLKKVVNKMMMNFEEKFEHSNI